MTKLEFNEFIEDIGEVTTKNEKGTVLALVLIARILQDSHLLQVEEKDNVHTP